MEGEVDLINIIISFIIYVPSLSVNPQYNFVYVTENTDYYGYNNAYKNTYEVDASGHLVLVPTPLNRNPYPEKPMYKADAPDLFIYDVKANTARQVTLEEMKDIILTRGPSSPDGYTVTYTYNNDGIFELFGGGGRDDGYVISKGKGTKRLTGLNNNDRYSYNRGFKLVGWIK